MYGAARYFTHYRCGMIEELLQQQARASRVHGDECRVASQRYARCCCASASEQCTALIEEYRLTHVYQV